MAVDTTNDYEYENDGLTRELVERTLVLAQKGDLLGIRKAIEAMNPSVAASVLGYLDEDTRATIFRCLHKDEAAAIFTYLDSDVRIQLVSYLSAPEKNDKLKARVRSMIDEMPADDAADLVDEMRDELPANLVEAILSGMDPTQRAEVNSILNYPEGSAGSIMTLEYIILREDITVAEALAQVRKQGEGKETIYNCYAVGTGRKIVGDVSLRDIILSADDTLIHDIMSTPVIYAHTQDDQEAVAAKFQEYDLLSMPVVDKEERIVGIITIDDVVDVIEEENTEDFEKMAALRPADDEYLKTGVFELARNRIVWLLILMISATFTGGIISHFQGILMREALLASFIPMLMDTGGNCGAQVSTLMIRGMAVGELDLSDCFRVLWKELRVGCVVAFVLCTINLVRMIVFVDNLTKSVAIIVNATLFVTIVCAKLVGCVLPMGAKRLGFDPALMASPMLTTVVDSLTLAIYFFIASHFLAFA